MNTQPEQAVLTAKDSTGIGNPILVEDAQHVSISVDGANTSALTLKFQGSISQDMPDFSAAQSTTNRWEYIEVKDLNDGSAIDGDTGLVMTANDNRLFEANVSGLRWFNARVTARTTGDVTVKVKPFNNG